MTLSISPPPNAMTGWSRWRDIAPVRASSAVTPSDDTGYWTSRLWSCPPSAALRSLTYAAGVAPYTDLKRLMK